MITDQEIHSLITLPKVITSKDPLRGYHEENRSRHCTLYLVSSDQTNRKFSVFVRQTVLFPKNFSIGILYLDAPGNLSDSPLTRYNGSHGDNSRAPDGHYEQPHIHYLTAAEVASGSRKPPERLIVNTDKYSTLEEALPIFFTDTNTQNYINYLPELLHSRLFHGY